MAVAGERHWWYRSTRSLLRELFDREVGPTGPPSGLLLDAAGGTGAAGGWLTELAPTVLSDVDEFSIGFATEQHPGYVPVRADLNQLPFAEGSFAVVVCVTALCHRMNPDPGAIVSELARLTAPGGVVLLLEPCGPGLRRGHDDVTHTARRFTVGELSGLCRTAGLDVQVETAAYSFLVPPAWLLARLERGAPRSDLGRNESGLFGLFGWLAGLERRLLARRSVRHGLSAVVVARKR